MGADATVKRNTTLQIINQNNSTGEKTMKQTIRLMLVSLAIATLIACSGKKEDVRPTETQPVTQTDTDRDSVTTGVDPNSVTNPRNIIDRPAGNPLSTRVLYFDFDQSTVRSEYRNVLSAHATYLNANPGARISLEGHADERGTREYNLGLSERRGFSVEELMDAQGGSDNQMTVVPYGEERPEAECGNESCWSKNRRVEIIYTKVQ